MSVCLTLIDFERFHAGELDEETSERFRAHLAECDACRVAYDQFAADQAFLQSAKSALGVASDVKQRRAARVASASKPSSDKAPPSAPKIDGYRITGVLGQGGMGIVYRAVQAKLNRIVALKVLPAMIGEASPSTVRRFRREATAAARLHHTHIVPIYDFGECPDAYYYAMELISGHPLNVVIRSFAKQNAASASPAKLTELLMNVTAGTRGEGGMPSGVISTDGSATDVEASAAGRTRHYYRQVAAWMADTADALHYAHGQGIIHRDVKPANLILSTDGRIMVADFGLAKSVGEESFTMTGSLLGTVRYLSPEQAMARRMPLDHRTDIYSLGATMYELLCFQPAYPGTDDKQVLSAIITREPTLPRKIATSVPPELETICLKSLEKAPAARYATARAMAEDLRRYTQDLPIEAKRPGPLARTFKFVRRHKAATLAGAAGVFLAVAIPMLIYINHLREKAEREETAAQVEELLQRARTAQRIESWSEAEEYYQKAIVLNPQSFQTYNNYAGLKKDLYNAQPNRQLLKQATELSAKALAIEPNHPTIWNTMGVLHKKIGEYDEAIEAYKKAIELEPDFVDAIENLGVVYALTGDIDGAQKHLERAAGYKGPRCETIWCSLAALDLVRNPGYAAGRIERAFQCNRQDLFSAVVRARVRLTQAERLDPPGALQDMLFADRLRKPGPAKLRILKRMLATAHLRNGAYVAAIEHAREAMRIGDMPTADWLIVAIAESSRGRTEAGRRALSKAQSKWPADLTAPGAFRLEAPEGVLWVELADELLSLRAEAERLTRVDSQ